MPENTLVTIRDWLRYTVSQFKKMAYILDMELLMLMMKQFV